MRAKTRSDAGAPAVVERRRLILDLVGRQGFVQVRHLTALLGVSEVTVRHDLRGLEESGDVQRVRGGARAAQRGQERYEPESWSSPAAGAMAAAFVRDGDTIFIDDGPGITSVVDALIARRDLSDVTVHTESVPVVVSFFGHDSRFTVVVPPGTLSPSLRVIPEAEDQEISVDLALIGCSGITLDGLLARTAAGAAASRRAAVAGRRVVAVVAPESGEVPAGHLICSLDRVDACITAERLADETARPLRAKGLKIFTVS